MVLAFQGLAPVSAGSHWTGQSGETLVSAVLAANTAYRRHSARLASSSTTEASLANTRKEGRHRQPQNIMRCGIFIQISVLR